MGDPLPVAAPGAVPAGSLVPETVSPLNGGLNVNIAGGSGSVTTAPPANPTTVPSHLASGTLPASGAYTTQTA